MPSAAPVVVTGGTGTVGQLVVDRLRAAGRDVRVLSRHPGEPAPGIEPAIADLSTGDGVAAALSGATTVVHCAGSARGDDAKARLLVRAAAAAGVTHLVHVSVVGVDRIPLESRLDRAVFGYYGAKLAAEQAVLESEVPCSILRATQFHDLIWTLARTLTTLPVAAVPRWRFQPVDAGEVADRLVELATATPAGRVADLGGPRTYALADLVRSYLRATGRRRVLVPAPMPGRAARVFAAGANLAPDHAVGTRTWEEFLAARVDEPPSQPKHRFGTGDSTGSVSP